MALAGNLPNTLPIPVNGIPTWQLSSLDSPLDVPVMGQFKPDVRRKVGAPIWNKRPGILGSEPYVRYIGKDADSLVFRFHCIAMNITDLYPEAAYARLLELAKYDSTLGRPPQVAFVYGTTLVKGYITNIPEVPVDYWLNTRMPREIGPIDVEITEIPVQLAVTSESTAYVPYTDDLLMEEACLAQYGEARLAPLIALWNQGVVVGETLELPRRSHAALTRTAPVAPAFDGIEDF